MNFLDLPTEIRLKIYTYLLIAQEPICFYDGFEALCPELLRTCKQIFLEASPALYSDNKFQLILDLDKDLSAAAPFLEELGSQTHLIRSISIKLTTFNTGVHFPNNALTLNKTDTAELDAIRVMCPSITTLEFLLDDAHPISDCLITSSWSPNTHDHFQALSLYLQTFPLLEKVIINLRGYVDEDGYPISRRAPGGDGETGESSNSQRTRRDDVSDMVQSLGFGWDIKMSQVEKPALYSEDDRCVFRCQEDLEKYEEMVREEEYQREKEREEAEWLEDYYERRNDPWRKNDSDYD
ncbi:hypothetical protein PG984_013480 [Apiospora sp. TS-2023a]